MPIISVTSREFIQDAGAAKKAASNGPVFVTDRGRPAHVPLTIEDYRRLTGGKKSLADMLAQPGADADFNFEPRRLESPLYRPVRPA
jgi:hypothetical protein